MLLVHFFFPDYPCRLKTVHLRHLYVHEDNVIITFICCICCYAAIAGNINIYVSGLFQHVHCNLLVDLVVFCNQNSDILIFLLGYGMTGNNSRAGLSLFSSGFLI